MPGMKRREPPGRSVAPRRASSTTPPTISPAPITTCVADAERLKERHRRGGEDQDGEDRAPAARPDPEREIEKDPGAAREREQREDEAHEGRIDAERIRDAAAYAGDDAVTLASLERTGSGSASRDADDLDVAGSDLCVDAHHAVPGVDLCVPSVVVDAEGVDIARP